MAVYERTYRRYDAALTPERSRWLVLPRYAWRDFFRGRLFSIYFTLCFVCPLLVGVLIYVHHNLKLLQTDIPPLQSFLEQVVARLPIDGRLFQWLLEQQRGFSFLIVLALAPAVIAPDLRNNGLPLYLSRPLSRAEYVAGKLVALLLPVSLVTWVAGLFLFLLQASLAGGSWFAANLRLGAGVLVGGLVWAVVASLLGLTIAAWVKWRPVARIVLLIVYLMPAAFAAAVKATLGTWWGELISLRHLIGRIWAGLLGVRPESELPAGVAWIMLLAAAALCLWLLFRRVRAYEVVR
jgi:ABC-2 type transport system permease protein